jgi:TP901 family phage tail tape measure protein
MAVEFDIRVVTGSSTSNLDALDRGLTSAAQHTNNLTAAISKIGTAAFAFNNIKSAVSGIADDFKAAVQPGIDLNDNLKDLQAITGVSDMQLQKISAAARDNAKAFGVDASSAVESYKFILSQLGPEIANNDKALSAMGVSAVTLSKQMRGDVGAATEVLTTAMNQYGVSLSDPMKASKAMADMMNVMSAAAQEGSAEMPQIKNALAESGMMAKSAGVSFGELNSAIQVLDKAGKKGAEGGVGIRNVLADISSGDLMHKRSKMVLEDAGISVAALADKNKTFSERLAMLKPIVNDNSKMIAVFGKENAAAAIALVQGTSELDRFTQKTAGTTSATDMAAVKMTSFKEVMSRVNAQIKDVGISIFNATQSVLPFLSIAGGGLKILGDFGMAAQGVAIIAETKFGAAIGKAAVAVGGFIKNIALSIFNVARQGVAMGVQAVVSVGSYVGSLIVATAAQLGLNAAMYANPIGIVVLGIVAAVAAIGVLIYYWDEIWSAIKKFTAWVWEHSPFKFLIDVVDNIFPGFKNAMTQLWDWVKAKFTALLDWFKNAWKSIKGFFGFGDDGTNATKEQALAMEAAVNDAVAKPVEVKAIVDTSGANISSHGAKADKHTASSKTMASNISSGGSRPTTIHLTIHKLQDQIVVHTTNLQMGAKEAGKQIVEELLMAINSVNGKVSAI